MRYMVIEQFKPDAAPAIYERLKSNGRMQPPGLTYIDSWISLSLTTCYQLMETDDPALLDQWTAKWIDLVDFEIVPVVTSAEAGEMAT